MSKQIQKGFVLMTHVQYKELDWFNDVLDFHRKFDCTINAYPCIPSPKDIKLRIRLLKEEIKETLKAIDDNDIEGLSRELVDIIYVTLGTALTYGVDLRSVWEEVHAANMKKEVGNKSNDGKVNKPDGWIPPNIAKILVNQSVISYI